MLEPTRITRRFAVAIGFCLLAVSPLVLVSAAELPKVSYFEIDASPPIGSPNAYESVQEVLIPLSCRGIVLLGSGQPIVLCAVDWIGFSNDGHKVFREELARGAGTSPERVAVHALHQHDAPVCDFSADELLRQQGLTNEPFDSVFARSMMRRAAEAVTKAVADAKPFTHIGHGDGVVEHVASNRRVLGADGKVKHIRWSANKDHIVRGYPEGVIDRNVKSVSFWNEDRRLVVLTWYATHPQSYYRTGKANPDFPGIARNLRQAATGVPHVHFCGAAGNVTAGKYNDGSPDNRQNLAERLASGMSRAFDAERKIPISVQDVGWQSLPVALPPAAHLKQDKLIADVSNAALPAHNRSYSAVALVWLRRCLAREQIDLSCLRLGPVRVLHMPGELFIEYQLAAQQLRPDLFVAMAAYGEYAPYYIGTEIAYEQGGYETSEVATHVAPAVETVLVRALEKLLDAPKPLPEKLGTSAAERESEYARQHPESK